MSDPIGDMEKLMDGYRLLSVGERIAPSDEVWERSTGSGFGLTGIGLTGIGEEPAPAWHPASEIYGFNRPGMFLKEFMIGRVRRSLEAEAKWPKNPCDRCRFFVPMFSESWLGECRRHAPPHVDVGRHHWCGDWEEKKETA